MDLKQYQTEYKADQAVGAQFIENKLKELYPNITANFYSPQVLSFQGGEEALDGVAIYKTEDFYHLISYGISHLYYNEQAVGQEFSKWGFEFSFRVKPFAGDQDDEPFWAIQLLQNLGKFVNDTKVYFDDNQFLPLGGPIRQDADTDINGIIFQEDHQLKEIETAHGKVKFLQIVGINQTQLKLLEENSSIDHVKEVLKEIKEKNPLFICDINKY